LPFVFQTATVSPATEMSFFDLSVYKSILMHVVKGAVNTLIVCWADNRRQIEAEHPEMSRTLLEAWLRSFPHSATLDPGSDSASNADSNAIRV
jgi:hypothetical protein